MPLEQGRKASQILFKEVFRRLWYDRCLTNAQALTYTTVFALVPLLALMLSMIRLFMGTEEMVIAINQGLSKILNPGALSKVQDTLVNLIIRAQNAPLGTASMIIFLTMVIGLFMQFEEVLNSIFRVRNQRSWWQRITVYWMGLTLGPLLIAMPLGITIYLTHAGLKGSALISPFSKVWTLLFITFFFWGVFLYLPAKKVQIWPAFWGAVLASIVWFLLAGVFAFYTSKAVAYSKLYGSLSMIPFFLFWLFINWLVLLLGAEITHVLEQKDLILAHYKYPHNQSSLFIGLSLLLEIYKRHRDGDPGPRKAELVEILQVSPFELEGILDRLLESSLIFELEDRYLPSKDSSRVSLQDLQTILWGDLPSNPPEEGALRCAYKFLEEKFFSCSRYTLKDLLDKFC